jgi:hypothetical protein
MTPLHPNQIWLLRIRTLITAVTMVLPVLVLDLALARSIGCRPASPPVSSPWRV